MALNLNHYYYISILNYDTIAEQMINCNIGSSICVLNLILINFGELFLHNRIELFICEK